MPTTSRPPVGHSAKALPHLLDVLEVALAVGLKAVEPRGGGAACCKDMIRVLERIKHREPAGGPACELEKRRSSDEGAQAH